MATARLSVSGQGETREFPLHAKGTIIGRGPDCDVILDSDLVSRHHARIFQDPFDRWILEDLGSQNGVLLGGERVQACAAILGDEIVIGPFSLSLCQELDQEIVPERSTPLATTLIEDATDMTVVRGSTTGTLLSKACLRELNHIIDRLAVLTCASELYPEVCRSLAIMTNTAVLIVRLPESAKPLPMSPTILACRHGSESVTTSARGTADMYLSRRVLDAIRSTGEAVMARSFHAIDEQLMMTVDEANPRAVLCAPVTEPGESMDVLYLDMPFEHATADVFDFVQAVTLQVRLARKSLLLIDAKAREISLIRQLEMAREIQTKLTPGAVPHLAGVDAAVYYKPAMWVGGDYCDVWLSPNGRLAFAVGDVSGKGLPAAMVMANLQAVLRTVCSFCSRPAEAVERVNQHAMQYFPSGMFVTLFLGFFDPQNGRLEYVNAGHIPPLLVRPHATVSPLGDVRNPIIGVVEGPFVADAETITPNTGLLVVTDGITEATSPGGELFGFERLKSLMRSMEMRSAQHMIQTTTEAADRFRESRAQLDDVTVFALLKSSAHD